MTSSETTGLEISILGDGALAASLTNGSGGLTRLTDRALDDPAQDELWRLGMAMASPIFVHDQLMGILTVTRKRSGFAYNRRERAFLDAIASHLAIAMERQYAKTERLGPYRVIRRLGAGGMAEVFLAEKYGPGGFELQVAIKRLMPHLSHDPRSIAMLLDEARIAARLRHPHIVRVFDVETYDDTYCLAMEYVDGPSLAQLVQPTAGLRQTLPLPMVAALITAVAEALEYSHGLTDDRGRSFGLVHRDVKPANILLSRRGEIKLADFGIARAEFRLQHTRTGNIRGTPPYLAPEVLLGKRACPLADIFALAAVAYEMISGRLAFPKGLLRPVAPPLLSKIRPDLPGALDDLMIRALAEDPERRFQTAIELRNAFLKAISPIEPATQAGVAELITDLWAEETELPEARTAEAHRI